MTGRAAAIASALALAACSSALDGGRTSDCEGGDAACPTYADAGAADADPGAPSSDAAAGSDAGAADPDDGGGMSAPPEGTFDGAECFDGRDNDAFGGRDCEEPGCAAQPVCCVGVASPECCTASLPPMTLGSLDDCAGQSASRCAALAGAAVFGSPEPFVADDGALVPNGDQSGDSGLVLPGEVRPQIARVTLRARIAAPLGCAGCVDAVAVSLAAGGMLGTEGGGVATLLVSGSRGDVSLLVGGAVAWRRDLPDDAEHDYELTVDPGGVVGLSTDAPGIAAATVRAALPQGALRVIVHGRTSNRAATSLPARLRSLAIDARGCDMPGALARGEAPVIEPVAPPWPEGSEHAPSIARPPGAPAEATRVAFAAGGAIWVARLGDDGALVPIGAGPALAPGAFAPGGLDDPDLIALHDRWLLVFTAIDAAGRRRIARVLSAPEFGDAFDPAGVEDLVTLPLADPGGEVVELDGASLAVFDGVLWVAARATRARGETALVLLRSGLDAEGPAGGFELGDVCGTGCDSLDEALAVDVHAPRAGDPAAFDHDEVAAPTLVRAGGVYRLYYAGRRGTRWSIGLLVSYDLQLFREGNGGAPILAPSGSGADALGVRDPEPWVDGDRFELFHTASDGVRTSLARATQPLVAR